MATKNCNTIFAHEGNGKLFLFMKIIERFDSQTESNIYCEIYVRHMSSPFSAPKRQNKSLEAMQKFWGQTHNEKKTRRWNPLENNKCKTFAIIIIPTIAAYHGPFLVVRGVAFFNFKISLIAVRTFFFSDCIFHGKDGALLCSMFHLEWFSIWKSIFAVNSNIFPSYLFNYNWTYSENACDCLWQAVEECSCEVNKGGKYFSQKRKKMFCIKEEWGRNDDSSKWKEKRQKKRKFHIVTCAKVVKQFNECHGRFRDIRFRPSTVRFCWEKKLIEIFQKANTAKGIARVKLFVLAFWATVFPTLMFYLHSAFSQHTPELNELFRMNSG